MVGINFDKIQTFEDNGLTGEIHTFMGGLHWIYTNKKGETLSIICHSGSYGHQDGKFETLSSWEDDVEGFLSFGEVQKRIEKLRKRGKRK